MKKDLPIYDIKLSDDTQGVGFISLVDEPAIGVDWIKLAKVTIKQEPKKVNSMMAKKALGTLDGSGCFGCPPNGDGTRVNGEPDGRCKGDGSGGDSKGGKVPSDKPLAPKDIMDIDIDQAKSDAIKDIDDSTKDIVYRYTGKPTGADVTNASSIVVMKDDVRRLLEDRIPDASKIKEGYYNRMGGYLVGRSSYVPSTSKENLDRLKSGGFVEVREYTSGPPLFHYNPKTGEYISQTYINESNGGFGIVTSNKVGINNWMKKYL